MLLFADFEARLDSVHAGHHHVEDEKLNLFPPQHLQRFHTIRRLQHAVAFVLQVNRDQIADLFLIIHDQNRYLFHNLFLLLLFLLPPKHACPFALADYHVQPREQRKHT